MSLDIELVQEGCRWYQTHITQNLRRLASAAGIYDEVFRPDELAKTWYFPGWLRRLQYRLRPNSWPPMMLASEITPKLERALAYLKADPEHFRRFADYEGFVWFVEKYLDSLKGGLTNG